MMCWVVRALTAGLICLWHELGCRRARSVIRHVINAEGLFVIRQDASTAGCTSGSSAIVLHPFGLVEAIWVIRITVGALGYDA